MEVTEKQLDEIRRGKAVEIVVESTELVLLSKEVYEEVRRLLEAEEVDPSFFECEEIES